MGERGARLSIIVYLFLAALKLTVGHIAGSEALKADGLNNTTDIVASVAVLVGLKISQRPPDKEHRYGHWKAEPVASLIAAFVMVAVGLQVLYGATLSVFFRQVEEPDPIAAWIGLFSAAIMYLVYRYNKKLALKIQSQSVMAAAKDNLSDAWVSIGAVIGILGSQLGLPWLDPVAALAVGLLICKTGWDIFRQASHDLTDGFDENQLEVYKESIYTVSGVKGIKSIKARKYGNNPVVDVIILVNSKLGIGAAHDISENVENVLMKEHDVIDVHVHVEPQ
ncbi:cation diffusion facilitator family transporter [Planococcus shenhongbingii]|uniref:Cation diffusion facilitator family transporter n=1 Tax=Planococcus shenhongbingii TaxID=3058398 RepID=A0ABT8NFT7_9BACL|nr:MULTISPECIES: cation diffusion facilitator family transporter [unclassified Planococcus (in: firmicutes)]MDN7246738.1 cation diffusion facilitator family transporter [Planococcus sp. N017]WKA60396.1 cation diffusion facilitator family transporter [Planococcus sp. N016]